MLYTAGYPESVKNVTESNTAEAPRAPYGRGPGLPTAVAPGLSPAEVAGQSPGSSRVGHTRAVGGLPYIPQGGVPRYTAYIHCPAPVSRQCPLYPAG